MLQALKPTARCKTPISTVAFSADGSRYLWAGGSPGEECSLVVSDVSSNKVVWKVSEHRKPVVRARFLSDGSLVSMSFDSHICHWSPAGELSASNNVRLSDRADGFAVTNDGKLAVIGDYRGGISGWNARTGSKVFTFQENDRKLQIWSLALSPDGKRLISGGAGGKIRIWNVAKQTLESDIDLGWGHHVQGLAFHPDGERFVAAIALDGAAERGAKSRVLMYRASKGTLLATLIPDGHQPFCCTLSPDGQSVAAAGGGTDRGGSESKANCVIHVWDLDSATETARLPGHSGLVRDLAFSPDGRCLLSAGWDETVRAWSLTDSK